MGMVDVMKKNFPRYKMYTLNMPSEGDHRLELKEEYDNGLSVYYKFPGDAPENPRSWDREGTIVELPDDTRLEFGYGYRTWTKVQLVITLVNRVGELKVTDSPDIIPINVAISGKPAIASYLGAVHGLTPEESSDYLDLSPETIKQYRVDYKNGRR